MEDEAKTREQLIRELVALRQRIVGLQEEEAERRRAEAGVKRHARQLEALYTISQTVSRTLDLHELLSESLVRVLKVMDADAGGIYLLDLQGGELILKAHSGVSEAFVGSAGSIKLEQGEIKRGLKWQQPAFEPGTVFAEGTLRRVAAAMEREGLRVQITVPFGTESVPLGALVVASRGERQFGAEDIGLLQAIGNEIALGIENAMLVEKTRELAITDELTGLYNRRYFYEVLEAETHRTRRYGSSFSLIMLDLDGLKEYNDRFGHVSGDAILQSLAQTLKSTLRKSDIAFRYGGDEFTIILPATHANRSKVIVNRIRSKWLRMLKAQYHLLDSPLGFSAGIAQFPEHAETADGLVFLADATLYRAKRQGGCNCTLVCDLQRLSPDARIAPTLDHVYALAGAVDAKDPHTYGHSKRVAAISEMIGKAIGLSEKELADLYAACLVHDIGKVGIPDSLLITLGKPTDEEWRVIKKHCAEGARIVSYVSELAPLVPIIMHHHEWYDGTGYPAGLKGEDIPIGARIIRVADAYDTMTMPRPHGEVMSQEEALEELRRFSGTQFDPELVEALCHTVAL